MKDKITGVAVAGLLVATLLFAIICAWPKIQNEEMLRDIKQYADGFGGTYDGRTIWRLGYHYGIDPYVETSSKGEHQELRVGDYTVIIGATLDDVSDESLVHSYRKGEGWVDGKVWSDDYTEEYAAIGDWIERKLYYNELNRRSISVGDVVDDSVEKLDIGTLVDLYRSGWDGRWLYCPTSKELAYTSSEGLIIIRADNTRTTTRVFPQVGYEPIPDGRVEYDPATGLMFCASEDGLFAYRHDGSVATSVPCDEFDPVNAFVFIGSYSNRAAYAGDGKIYRITFDGEFELMFDDFDHLSKECGNFWTFFRKNGVEYDMYGKVDR